MVYQALLPLLPPDAHTTTASSRLNWRPPANLNGLVRFAERPSLVSARVPSRFKRALPQLPPCISAAIHVCLVIFCWYSGWRARIRGRVHAQFETVRVIS